MTWIVTVKSKLKHSVQLRFEQHLRPTKQAIVKELHEMFPEMRVSLRTELIDHILAGEYVVATRDATGALTAARE